jgi:hypothetical protein
MLVERTLPESLTDAARVAAERSDWERDREAWNLPRSSDPARTVRLLSGRFEARFEDGDTARAAARDARAVGFVVDVQPAGAVWLAVGRRTLPFPPDERDRYASRFRAIATLHGGGYAQFVEEGQGGHADGE